MSGIAVRIPLIKDKQNGFELLQNYNDVVTQNLKMLVLTCPGERIMDPEFGVGARNFLFELSNSQTRERFKTKLLEQQQKYLPFLTIQDIQFFSTFENPEIDENTINIKIFYFNKIFKTSGALSLPIT
jgi:phage baseplate assembly protein W